MKTPYEFRDGKTAEIEVSSAVAEVLAGFAREDENEARNKRRRNEASIEAMYEETGWEAVDTTVNIEADYIASEEKETLLTAVEQLSEKQQRLVWLYYYEEKSSYEIATILGINQSNVIRQLETISKVLKKYF
jgi:RNA polymerase sigma factor (sigma-70 family)